MKYWISLILICSTMAAFSQIDDLPRAVARTFEKKFPGVTDIKWYVEKGDYKIKFTLNGKKTVAEIDPDGTWEKTSTHITFEELPAPVKTTVNEQKKSGSLDEIKSVVDDEGSSYYRIDIIDSNYKTKLWINPKGKLEKSEKKELKEAS